MSTLVRLKLPGTEPSTIYVDADRIFAIRDRGMTSRKREPCSSVEFALLDDDGGIWSYNVVGTPDEVAEEIRRARAAENLGTPR